MFSDAVSFGFKMVYEVLLWVGRLFTHFRVSIQKSWFEKKKNDQSGWTPTQSWLLFTFMSLARISISPIRALSKANPVWPPSKPKK